MNAPAAPTQDLHSRFPGLVSEPSEFRGETTVQVGDATRITEVLRHARQDLGFDLLLDMTGVDHLGEEPRFEIVYHLYSFASHRYLRIKTRVGEEKAELPTAATLWRAADWHEREIYDLLGIRFTGHPDLRRILMWDSYPHHPLRKDFPLAGRPTDDGRANRAPMAGGPFVTSPGEKITREREPRGKGESNRTI